MKKQILTLLSVIALLAIPVFSGCNIVESGEVITQEEDYIDFTRVDIGSAFDAEIIKSDSFSVTIKADESFIDYIVVSKEGDTLVINLKPHHLFTDFTLGSKTLEAEINMPTIEGLIVSGATKATASGFKSSEDLDIEVSGASTLNLEDIEARDVEFNVSGASTLKGTLISTGDAELEVSGASKVELEGSASFLELDGSGASTIELGEFPLSGDADVKLSGASKATVNLKEMLDCTLSAASSLYFIGNPTMGDIDISGASTIKHK
jgi:hypothetical protein